MATLDALENRVNLLLSQEEPPLAELRKVMLEIEEYLSTDEFQAQPADGRSRLQNARKDLKARIRQQEDEAENPAPAPFAADVPTIPSGQAAYGQVRQHNPNAEQQMEEAEKLFYSGRYAEAIKLYDRVLQIEANWERAKQHRSESENYLRTGYIPAVALPSDAASAFGKAQSAARVGRYADALALLNKAQAVLRELGIQRWQEGQEFEQKLQENIDAENVYQEGLRLFDQGRLEDAIERVETASRATGLPKYGEKAQELRRVKETIRAINEALNATAVEPKMASQAKADLDNLISEYGDNAALQRLRGRLEAALPRVVAPLKEQTRAMKAQAERSPTIEGTLYLARQARQQLDQIRNLEGVDESLDRLQAEVDKLLRDVQKCEDELGMAAAAYDNKRNWPTEADRLSAEVRRRFPNDPGVAQLNRQLGPYHRSVGMLKLMGAGVIVIILGTLLFMAYGRVQAFVARLTPTATATSTATATLTPTLTHTPTVTLTPAPTATFTLTPTPLIGLTLRDVWARTGCYESFTAVGRIPGNSDVSFLPDKRQFDTLNRECVLVKFTAKDNSSIIGWILVADVTGKQ